MTDDVILSNDEWSTAYYDINVEDSSMFDQVNFTPVFFSDMGTSGHTAPKIFTADALTVSYFEGGGHHRRPLGR